MLNLPNGPHTVLDQADLPVWRRDNIPHSRRKRFADGMVDILTWTPRRVRLIADGDTVSRVCFRGGDALPKLNLDHEPHTRCGYRTAKPGCRSGSGIHESISHTQSVGAASRSCWPSVTGELIHSHRSC